MTGMHTSPAQPIRVVAVDDSQLMLTLVSRGLEEEGDIQVVGTAKNVQEARQVIKLSDPHVVTLDVEMPGMNGLAFLEKIMELRPMPVIMVSTLTASGTEVTLNALEIGAVDALAKPVGKDAVKTFARALRQKVRAASQAKVLRRSRQPAPVAAPAAPRRAPPPAMAEGRTRLIALGASTGGVGALSELLHALPANTPPIVITQHMPAEFTGRFASRLNAQLPQDVGEGQDGEVLRPGMIRIAPGNAHLAIQKRGRDLISVLDGSGPISGHRPSVDVLFNTAATATGRATIAAILTGMGRDGAAGLRALRQNGAYCLGQSERSCVVYGMPKAAKALDAVDEELDLPTMADRIRGFLSGSAVRKTG